MDMEEKGIKDPRVLTAMATVPRHRFVLPEDLPYAYEDQPLPIGYGQTISQPYIVALMTQLLDLKDTDRVLEVGTGSGYQTAILAEIARKVYTIEVIPPLAHKARQTLKSLGYTNIEFRIGDGYHGWEEAAPFEAIIVTAAHEEIPSPLPEQLAEGGRLVLPVGPANAIQILWRIVRCNGILYKENHGFVRFVPFVRKNYSAKPDFAE